MKIFISHASANKEIVLRFTEMLETLNDSIETFCSSEEGSIRVGSNSTEVILEELDNSDIFVPILSKEYYESRYCMIELGIACSHLFAKFQKNGENYIFPFAIYPVRKGQALSGTPIANIQVGDINSTADIRSLLDFLAEQFSFRTGSGINQKLRSCVFDIDRILLKNQDLMADARVGVFFDDSIPYESAGDIILCNKTGENVTVNFNTNPYDRSDIKYPNFLSLVFRYVDTVDIGKYLDYNESASLVCILTSFTNSITNITVEFKHNGTDILDSYKKSICYGENRIGIPLALMRSEALHKITEICFVLHPEDLNETEGMFQVSSLRVELQ